MIDCDILKVMGEALRQAGLEVYSDESCASIYDHHGYLGILMTYHGQLSMRLDGRPSKCYDLADPEFNPQHIIDYFVSRKKEARDVFRRA